MTPRPDRALGAYLELRHHLPVDLELHRGVARAELGSPFAWSRLRGLCPLWRSDGGQVLGQPGYRQEEPGVPRSEDGIIVDRPRGRTSLDSLIKK